MKQGRRRVNDPRVGVNASLIAAVAYAFADRDLVTSGATGASDAARTEAWGCYERAASNRSTVAAARHGQALLRRDQGRLDEAVALLEQALAATDPADPHGRGITLLALAEVLAQRGDPSATTTAVDARREAQRLSTMPGDDLGRLDELLARTAPEPG